MNVYKIESDKGFLACFQGKKSYKWHIYAGIPKKIVDKCFIL